MSTRLSLIAGIVLVVLALGILFGAYTLIQSGKVGVAPVDQDPDPFVPIGSGTTQSVEATVPLTLADGTVVAIPDFSKTEQPPAASATNGYQVAGSADAEFQILYFPLDAGFILTLQAEPLGETRRAAEAALRQELGLPDAQVCQLTIDVGVPHSVSTVYSGRNLGLSFCPGAVPLP